MPDYSAAFGGLFCSVGGVRNGSACCQNSGNDLRRPHAGPIRPGTQGWQPPLRLPPPCPAPRTPGPPGTRAWARGSRLSSARSWPRPGAPKQFRPNGGFTSRTPQVGTQNTHVPPSTKIVVCLQRTRMRGQAPTLTSYLYRVMHHTHTHTHRLGRRRRGGRPPTLRNPT